MGDWIWVLITALITFVGLFAINFTPQEEPNSLLLEFPGSSAQVEDENSAAIREAIKEQIWTSPPTGSTTTDSMATNQKVSSLVAKLDSPQTNVSNSIPILSKIDPAVWGPIVAIPLAILMLKLFQFLRRSVQNSMRPRMGTTSG